MKFILGENTEDINLYYLEQQGMLGKFVFIPVDLVGEVKWKSKSGDMKLKDITDEHIKAILKSCEKDITVQIVFNRELLRRKLIKLL